MNGQTHVKIAVASALAFSLVQPYEMIPLIGGSILGGLVPDIDAGGTIANYFPITNKIIRFFAGKSVVACYHRHIFHSILFLPLIFFLLIRFNLVSGSLLPFIMGMLIGTLSHIIADVIIGKTWALYPIIRKPISILSVGAKDHPDRYEKVDKFFGVTAYLLSIGLIIWKYFI